MNIGNLNQRPSFYNFFSSPHSKKAIVIEIISSLLILLFVYAALSKLFDYKTFLFQLRRSPYIKNMAEIVVWLLPLGELIIVLTLAIKRTRTVGLYLSFFLMLLFTGYIYLIQHFSYYVPCSCGGVLSNMSWNQHLIFNLGFVFLSLTGILLSSSNQRNGV
jgi:hypothetical protein